MALFSAQVSNIKCGFKQVKTFTSGLQLSRKFLEAKPFYEA